jgi:hypothetical protein
MKLFGAAVNNSQSSISSQNIIEVINKLRCNNQWTMPSPGQLKTLSTTPATNNTVHPGFRTI